MSRGRRDLKERDCRKIGHAMVHTIDEPSYGFWYDLYYYGYNQEKNYSIYKLKNFDWNSFYWELEPDRCDFYTNSGYFRLTIGGREIASWHGVQNVDIRSEGSAIPSFIIYHGNDGGINSGAGFSVYNYFSELDGRSNGYGGTGACITVEIPKNIQRIVGYGGDVYGNVENHYTYYEESTELNIYGNADSRVGFIFDHWESDFSYNGSSASSINPVAYVPQTQPYYTRYRIRTFNLITKVACWYGTNFNYKGITGYKNNDIWLGNYEPTHEYTSELVGSTSINSGGPELYNISYLSSFTYGAYTPNTITAIDSRNYHLSHWIENHDWQESGYSDYRTQHGEEYNNPEYTKIVYPRKENGVGPGNQCHPNTNNLTWTAVFAPNEYEIGIEWDTEHIEKVTYFRWEKIGDNEYGFVEHYPNPDDNKDGPFISGNTYKFRYKDCFQLKAYPKENCSFTQWSDGCKYEHRGKEDYLGDPLVVLDETIKWYEALGDDKPIPPGDPGYKGVKIVTVRSCRVEDYDNLIENNTSDKVYIEIEITEDTNYPVDKKIIACEDENGNPVDITEIKQQEGSDKIYVVVKTKLDAHLSSYYYFTIRDTRRTYRHVVYIRSGIYTLVEYQNNLNNNEVGVGLGVLPNNNCLTLSGDINFVVPNEDNTDSITRNCFDFVNGQFKKESIAYDSGILKNCKVVDDNKYKWVCDVYSIEGSRFLKCSALLKTTVTIHEKYNELVLLDFSYYGISFATRMPVDVVMFYDAKEKKEQVGIRQCAIVEDNQVKTTEPMDKDTILYINLWLPLLDDRYDLTIECGEGITKVNRNPYEGNYVADTNIVLTATLENGYILDRWEKLVDGEYATINDLNGNPIKSPTLAIRIEKPSEWDGKTYKTDNKYKVIATKE